MHLRESGAASPSLLQTVFHSVRVLSPRVCINHSLDVTELQGLTKLVLLLELLHIFDITSGNFM